MSNSSKYALSFIFLLTIFSCKKEDNTPNVFDVEVKDFLYNIPIIGDTIYIDRLYGNDFRVDLNGYKIEAVKIDFNHFTDLEFDTAIINTASFNFGGGIWPASFTLKTTKVNENDTILIKSRECIFKVVDNVSKMFVHESCVDGRLKITWPELDKKYTQYYLLERCMGENQQFIQQFKIYDSVFTDNNYVGQKVNYKISVINKDNGKQNTWNHLKESEVPILKVTQHPVKGYVMNFSRCKYYNNFGKYIITTRDYSDPAILFNSESVSDTSYYAIEGKFGDEVDLWLRCLPKVYPEGVTYINWELYSTPLFARYYKKCFPYDGIAVLDEKNFVFTNHGHIYKFNLDLGRKVDSMLNFSAEYGFLRATPGGKYFYALNESLYGSPIYLWSADAKFTSQPAYTFQINYVVPQVSDNLMTVINTKDNKLAIFNVVSGQNVFTTPYSEVGLISPNGQFMFIKGSTLKLCSFIDNNFKIEWEISNAGFYSFDPFNPDICYIWNGNFMIRRISDSSILSSYSLNVESIINIDFFSRRMLCYIGDKLIIYNVDSGIKIKEIPAKLISLMFSGHSSGLIGNTIYCNHEMRYDIEF
jgi:hypothetical protein